MIKRNYRQHCADVLRNCPKEKLLVLDQPNCGWEVICKFVGKPVPEGVEWPHKNKKGGIVKEMFAKDRRMPQVMMKEQKQQMMKGLILCAVGAGTYFYVRKNRNVGQIFQKLVQNIL